MKHALKVGSFAALLLASVQPALAQTADEIVEKHLAALGGRAALEKVSSQVATGTVSLSTQMGNIPGTFESSRKAPNKSRTVMVLDLSSAGAGEMVVDQRCDGTAAWAGNSMQGNRDITGNQLQGMLNNRFPTPLLTYKTDGGRIEFAGKDKVGDRDVFVLSHTPKAGAALRYLIDAQTYHLVRAVSTVDLGQAGGQAEQTSEPRDYRAVDGIQVPFSLTITNPAQTVSITLSKVELNKPLDDAIFAKPGVK
jgi:hypothetical protein